MSNSLAILGDKPSFSKPLYVTLPSVPEISSFVEVSKKIFDSRWLTNDGYYVRKLESVLKNRMRIPYCSVLCNGTLALELAIRSLGLKGEIITTPFTFVATAHAISRNGIRPIFCDIEKDTYNIDASKIEELITSKTSAILPVHVFGNPCDIKTIEIIAKKYSLKVIYDAAHAFDVKYMGNNIAQYGDLSVFSFHATKIFNTLEGGAVSCKSKEICRAIKDLRNFGIRSEEEIVCSGTNAKMNELQAAFGLLNLSKVTKGINKRKKLYNRYVSNLNDIPGLLFQKINNDATYNYAYFTVQVSDNEFGLNRDDLYTCMRKEGVMVRKYFWPLCSNLHFYKASIFCKNKALSSANLISNRILSLPLHETMKEKDVDVISRTIRLCNTYSNKIIIKLNKLKRYR